MITVQFQSDLPEPRLSRRRTANQPTVGIAKLLKLKYRKQVSKVEVATRPPQHVHDVIVEINGHPVWRARADLRPDDERCFYDGDYSDVLEPDDSRVMF